MSHGGGGKRKRQDRHASSHDDSHGRPSPHKPESMNLAQQAQRYDRQTSGRGRNRGGNAGNANNDRIDDGNTPHRQHNDSRNASPRSTPQPVSNAENRPSPRPDPPRAQSPPRQLPRFFAYDHITDDIVGSWGSQGRVVLVQALAHSTDPDILGEWLQELIQSVLTRRLSALDAAAAFKDAASQRLADITPDLQDLLVDTVTFGNDSDWHSSAYSGFLANTGISTEAWRNTLSPEALVALGLVKGPSQAFVQIRTRKMTNLLYRQANYNLLREESEGYAKLITEYFNTAMTANALESAPTLAEDAFQRVKALIGSFDLDVSRVLDITLDVFANLLVRNFRFFVKYIRASAWWPAQNIPDTIQFETDGLSPLPGWALPGAADWGLGQEETERNARDEPLKTARDIKFWERVKENGMDAFCELSARRITNYDDKSDLLQPPPEQVDVKQDPKSKEKDELKRRRIRDTRQWMRETRTLPPNGNADAAQLLGFKLRFYASPARDESDIMPENLIFLTALLIKIGFISLRDIYPHLYPSDEKMADVKIRLTEEQSEQDRARRPGGTARNALAMSGALSDDSGPPAAIAATRAIKDNLSSKAASPKPEGSSTPKSETADAQKLPEPPNQKLLLLKSLLAIGALPEALFIMGRFPWLTELIPDLPEYIHRILHHMLTKVYEPLRPMADRQHFNAQRTLVNGTKSGAVRGALKQADAPARVTKRWANLDRADMGDGSAFKFYWDEWADGIPICRSVDDVFLLCNTFLNLSGVKIGKDPSLLLKLARIGKHSLEQDRSPGNEARWIDMLKTLLVPALSLTHRNPGVINEVFDLLKLFPTDVRYGIYTEWHFGPIARQPDMRRAFGFTQAETRDVLKRLSKTNARAMGKTLAKAAYGSPGIVLQTAISQMESYANLISVFVECSKYFTYLGYDVLTWCLLNALGGASRNRIQADGMLTSAWLRALSSFAGAVFKKYSSCDPTPVLQFIASELQEGDSTDLELLEQVITGMTGIKSDMTYNDAQILAMAGGDVLRSQTILGMGDERHLNEKSSKRLMRCLDEAGLSTQLLIAIAQERQMYAYREEAKFAPLKVLGNNVDKIHQVAVQYLDLLQTNTSNEAFFAAMPDIASLIRDYHLAPEVAFMIGRGSINRKMTEIDAAKKLEGQKPDNSKAGINNDVAMTDANDDAKPDHIKKEADTMEVDPVVKQQADSPEGETFWHPALSSLIQDMPSIIGNDVSSTINMPFYVTFWTLSLQDIVVNTSSYDQELATQTALQNQTKADRTDMSVAGIKERDRKVKAIVELKERLSQEMKKQIGAYTQIRTRLIKEKEYWFQAFHKEVDTLHISLLQNCFLPRVSISSLDAHYSFTMLKFLHNNGTPGFRTMKFYDRLMLKNQIVSLIFCNTVLEAENFGRFLNEILKELASWHADKTIYEKSAYGAKRQLPGFTRKLKADYTPETFLEYEDFRNLLWKWHSNLDAAFRKCFDSEEYMHIRNAIIVLKCIHHHFPAINFMGTRLMEKLDELAKKEERGDIKLAATSLHGNLRRREKSWMLPQAFRINKAATATGAAGTPPPKSSPAPQSLAPAEVKDNKVPAVPVLNAQAAAFRPQPGDDKDVEPPKSAVTEDGEIKDDRTSFSGGATKDSSKLVEDKPMATNLKSEAKQTSEGGSVPRIQILKRPQSEQGTNPSARSPSANSTAPNDGPNDKRTKDSKLAQVIDRQAQNLSVPRRSSPPRSASRSSESGSRQDRPRNYEQEVSQDTKAGQFNKNATPFNARTRSPPGQQAGPSRRNEGPRRDEGARRGEESYRDDQQGREESSRGQIRPEPMDRNGTRGAGTTRSIPPSRTGSQDSHNREKDQSSDARTSSRNMGRVRDGSPSRTGRLQDGSRQSAHTANQVSADAISVVNPARLAAIEQGLRESVQRPRSGQQGSGTSSPAPIQGRPLQGQGGERGRRESSDGRFESSRLSQGPDRGREVFPDHTPSGPRSSRDDGRRPPIMPSSSRHANQFERRDQGLRPESRQEESTYGRLSAPPTPRTAPPQPQPQSKSQHGAAGAADSSDFVHPSRLAQLPRDEPPRASAQPQPPSAPSAPRSAGRDSNDAPPPRDTPGGPAGSQGRGQDRRFVGLNDALQAGDRGTSIRGRAGRASGPTMLPPPVPDQPQPGSFDGPSRSAGSGNSTNGPASLSSRLGSTSGPSPGPADRRVSEPLGPRQQERGGRQSASRDSSRDGSDRRPRGTEYVRDEFQRGHGDRDVPAHRLDQGDISRERDQRAREGDRGRGPRDEGTSIKGASQMTRETPGQRHGQAPGHMPDHVRSYRPGPAPADEPMRRDGRTNEAAPDEGRRDRGLREEGGSQRGFGRARDEPHRGGRADNSRGGHGLDSPRVGDDRGGREGRDGRKRRGDDYGSGSNLKRRRSGA